MKAKAPGKNDLGRKGLAWLKVCLLAVVLVAGVGPIHQWVHILQAHRGAGEIYEARASQTLFVGSCHRGHDKAGNQPDGSNGEKPQSPHKNDHHKNDQRDCPECQVLNSLRTLDPPPVHSDRLFVNEQCESTVVHTSFIIDGPHFRLPSIRAPPAG